MSSPRPCLSSFMGAIRDRLSTTHPQQVLDELMALWASDKDHLAAHTQLFSTMMLLAQRGARLATEDPGCAFATYIQKYRLSPGLIGDMRDELIKIPGELPFHVLARTYLWEVSDQDMEDPQVLDCVRARDCHGRTASHWIWDHENVILAEAAQARANPAEGQVDPSRMRRMTMEGAWDFQVQLEKAGAGLEVPDHMGTTALDLCIERIRNGTVDLLPDYDICQRVQALIDSRAMQSATLRVTPTHPPTTPRL